MSGQFKQNCTACRKDDKLRRIWGCDAPSEAPQFHIEPCSICSGSDPKCEGCTGTGREAIFRCPVLSLPEMQPFLTAYAMYKKGMLPEPGGFLDQPHTFIDACLILDGLVSQGEKGKNASK